MAVHQKILHVLVTEIFKVKNTLVTDIMNDVFESKEPRYNLRTRSNHFTCRNDKTAYYGLLSVKYLALQIWKLVPQNVKNVRL